MKVLYIHHNEAKGGASNSLRYMLQQLSAFDVDIHIASPKGPAFDRFLNITSNVYEIPSPALLCAIEGTTYTGIRLLLQLKNIGRNKAIIDLALRIKPDIVHLNEIGLMHLAKGLKKRNLPVCLHSRVVLHRRYEWLSRYTIRQINKYADELLCIDGSVMEKMARVKRKTLVYNPLQPISIVKKRAPRGKVLKCVFLSNFLITKGIFDAIHAAVLLKEEKDIRFIICGDNVRGRDYYDSLKGRVLDMLNIYPDINKRVRAIVRRHKLENVDLRGNVDDINAVLEEGHVLLMPIHMNEPNRSVFEAGAHEVPTILSLIDKVDDVVEDGYNGVVIPQKNPEALKEAILRLRDNDDERVKMGERSRERFEQLNDPERSARKVFNIYLQVLNISANNTETNKVVESF